MINTRYRTWNILAYEVFPEYNVALFLSKHSPSADISKRQMNIIRAWLRLAETANPHSRPLSPRDGVREVCVLQRYSVWVRSTSASDMRCALLETEDDSVK